MYQELQDHWRCDTHVDKFCYKAHNHIQLTEHVQMEPKMLQDWATLILNCLEKNNIYNLPRIQEFVVALRPKCSTSTPLQQQPQQQPNFIFLPQPDAYDDSYSHSQSRLCSPLSSLQSSRSHHSREHYPRMSTKHLEIVSFSSLLIRYLSWEKYNRNRLLAFMNFCENKCHRGSDDTEFKEAYRILSNEKIGIDTLKNKDEN